ncbi:YeeE/YedE family protein [Hansschlegelia zhihuaiae]|uniref:YeeE/YedE family protein n=1 Tax=Hansschlegelia zhihuaiae TaxID=405005 RepID=A0A4Q0MIL7_9HYPH|nr:YeeE/YedE family protein [Hansschlegelia zhihuaiae]RXF73203.1 YeeE/YedE family protein [Hansschlegelia zhihuaiae]
MSLVRTIVGGLSGLVFGLGLTVSGMLDPARVRAFLDVAGPWDPSLAFTLCGAVLVASVGVWLSGRMSRPVFDDRFHLPETRTVDDRLVTGAALFGVGWGMAGLCPGPAIASLVLGIPATLFFFVAMVLGMALHDRLSIRSVWRTRSVDG